MCLISKAQYNYSNLGLYAAIAAEIDDTYRLNNIRFDESAIVENPEAWRAYGNYLSLDVEYMKKSKMYSAIGWTGVGVACLSLIPICVSNAYDYNGSRSDAVFGVGIGLCCAGGIASCVGLIGMAFNMDKIKMNKKNFIYYLKTTNNGIGIVSIF